MINSALIIDGAYLMISAKYNDYPMWSMLQTKEGVKNFTKQLSQNLAISCRKLDKDKLSKSIISVLNNGDASMNFLIKHILYAVNDSGFSPEGIQKEAWEGFSVPDNIHKYKGHTVSCRKCGQQTSMKVQAGVDVGIATRIAEILLENATCAKADRISAIVLIAGDRDFSDIMQLCNKYSTSIFLLGFKDNVDQGIKKIAVEFFLLQNLVKPVNIKPIRMPMPKKDSPVVVVKGVSVEFGQEEFVQILNSYEVRPTRIVWSDNFYKPENVYIVLAFDLIEDATKCIDCVFF